MDIGNKRFIFPGPGEVEIKLPAGSIATPLIEARSGPLLMAIDCYEQVSKQHGGLATSLQSLKPKHNNSNVPPVSDEFHQDPLLGQSEPIVQSAAECVLEVLGGFAPHD